jgi:cell division protein FtsB
VFARLVIIESIFLYQIKIIIYTIHFIEYIMKRIFFPIVLIISVVLSSFGQMSKEETKEWAKKMKTLTPESYKQLIQERETLTTEVGQLKQENDAAKAQVDDLNTKLKSAQEALEAKQQVAAAAEANVPVNTMAAKGVVYKVQIGAFKNKDLSKYFENNKNFSGEVDTDGNKNYTLGAFPTYWEADNFKKYLREMGVSDAWVVAYKEGKRIELKDALEGTL